MITINARGMGCPKPVIETKKALENISSGSVRTEVDNETARLNLEKLAQSLGYVSTSGATSDGLYFVEIQKGEEGPSKKSSTEGADLILFTKADLGQGDEKLAQVLMKGFIYTLTELEKKPKTLLFLNGGILLTTEGSACLEDLKKLEAQGAEIISCGTCLDYYQAKEKLQVGRIGNMYDIAEKISQAPKVVTL